MHMCHVVPELVLPADSSTPISCITPLPLLPTIHCTWLKITYCSTYCSITASGPLKVTIKITEMCFRQCCNCIHYFDNCISQLKPRHVFIQFFYLMKLTITGNIFCTVHFLVSKLLILALYIVTTLGFERILTM